MSARAGVLAACLALLLLGACGEEEDPEAIDQPPVTGPLDRGGSDLFVLRGPAVAADGRIEVQSDVVEWFSDRPKRKAGVAAADELVQNWEPYGFATVPPNAALAGSETDAEVELTKPRVTADGLSFAYKPLRGEVAADEEALSIFIDSSEYATDMHVYVAYGYDTTQNTNGWCSASEGVALANPTINTAPGTWSYYPVEDITLTESGQEVFTAASKSGSTKFSVTYDVYCVDGSNRTSAGTVKLNGSVPDSPSPDSFSCDGAADNPVFYCNASSISGYHVKAHATLEYKEGAVNSQITD
jgi:hypothetical protein